MDNSAPMRIRMSFNSREVIEVIQGLSSKYRSRFVEGAIVSWLKTKEGQSLLQMLKIRPGDTEPANPLPMTDTLETESETPEADRAEIDETETAIAVVQQQTSDHSDPSRQKTIDKAMGDFV